MYTRLYGTGMSTSRTAGKVASPTFWGTAPFARLLAVYTAVELSFVSRAVGALSLHDEWRSLGSHECLVGDGGCIGSDHTSDTHEEAVSGGQQVSTHPTGEETDSTDPNVAPEPSEYWPSVLMMPLGPAPYLKILTVPAWRVSTPPFHTCRMAGTYRK
jgi:hypothetical protein